LPGAQGPSLVVLCPRYQFDARYDSRIDFARR
jgi:hypothetical protein